MLEGTFSSFHRCCHSLSLSNRLTAGYPVKNFLDIFLLLICHDATTRTNTSLLQLEGAISLHEETTTLTIYEDTFLLIFFLRLLRML